ncbi:MAG TPA: hypothetical protein VN176_00935 [Verrucomicrobiae bacterium]|nr:hypothetical protein [Verrucomicrobiae bacterium]
MSTTEVFGTRGFTLFGSALFLVLAVAVIVSGVLNASVRPLGWVDLAVGCFVIYLLVITKHFQGRIMGIAVLLDLGAKAAVIYFVPSAYWNSVHYVEAAIWLSAGVIFVSMSSKYFTP